MGLEECLGCRTRTQQRRNARKMILEESLQAVWIYQQTSYVQVDINNQIIVMIQVMTTFFLSVGILIVMFELLDPQAENKRLKQIIERVRGKYFIIKIFVVVNIVMRLKKQQQK